MIGQSLVIVCATLAFAAGSCIQTPFSQGLVSSCGAQVSAIGSPVATIGSPMTTIGSGIGNLAGGVLSSLSGYGLASGSGLGLPLTDGPSGTPVYVAQAPSVTLPTVQTPVVPLPSQPIFPPRVISQRCVCTKTIVKPQIYQRTVTVPKVQRYFKRTVTPIVENIAHQATPVSSYGSSVGVASRGGLSSAVVSRPVALSSPVVVSNSAASSSPLLVSGQTGSCAC